MPCNCKGAASAAEKAAQAQAAIERRAQLSEARLNIANREQAAKDKARANAGK